MSSQLGYEYYSQLVCVYVCVCVCACACTCVCVCVCVCVRVWGIRVMAYIHFTIFTCSQIYSLANCMFQKSKIEKIQLCKNTKLKKFNSGFWATVQVYYGGREGPFQTSNFSICISELIISKLVFLKLSFQNLYFILASSQTTVFNGIKLPRTSCL